jgi:hypothetical protein
VFTRTRHGPYQESTESNPQFYFFKISFSYHFPAGLFRLKLCVHLFVMRAKCLAHLIHLDLIALTSAQHFKLATTELIWAGGSPVNFHRMSRYSVFFKPIDFVAFAYFTTLYQLSSSLPFCSPSSE